jgi:glutamate synthase (NADPH/NADH) small chain
LVVDPDSGVTSVAGLYAGGDCISKGAEVVNAVEEGKIAARGISDFLAGRGEG